MPMVISITSMLVVRVGGSYLLGLHFGLGAIGVWLAMVGDWVVRSHLLRAPRPKSCG
ncbi:MAG: hypothetical protein ACLRWQ_22470 [Flavonifractor plautii]